MLDLSMISVWTCLRLVGRMMLSMGLHPALLFQICPKVSLRPPFQISKNESTSTTGLLCYAAPEGLDRCLILVFSL